MPKRDDVNGRYYLIHKPDTSPKVLAEADLCIQDVLDGTARENHSDYPTVVRNHNGAPFLPNQLMERYLSRLPLRGFLYEDAVAFCDAMRLVSWEEIRYELEARSTRPSGTGVSVKWTWMFAFPLPSRRTP